MRFCSRLLSTLFITATIFATSAMADVTLCLYGGSYQCYETDLTCADVNIGVIIQGCTDMVVGPGGGVGGTVGVGVLQDLHPVVDGQPVVGLPGYLGDPVQLIDGNQNSTGDFVVTWQLNSPSSPGRSIQAIATDSSGALYLADFPVAGIDRFAAGDLVITGTPSGEEVDGPFGDNLTGRIAGGDMTVSVFVVPANEAPTKTTILETYHTDIVFNNLTWTYLGDGPVAAEVQTWGTIKTLYR